MSEHGIYRASNLTLADGQQSRLGLTSNGALRVSSEAASGAPSGTLPPGTDRSGTITTGGTAQQLAPANSARTFLKGQNTSTGDLWINETGGTASAASPSFRVPAGATFSVNTSAAISIFGATTGQAFSATEG